MEDVKAGIIQFAASKLLNCHHSIVNNEISKERELACLSLRFPIEFYSTTYAAQVDARKQVERHLRVCLNIDPNFENMTTVSPSEPVLSEAACFIMNKPSFDAPRALQNVLNGFAVSKGDRGEFLVMLLLTLARDTVVGYYDEDGRPESRLFALAPFLSGALFRSQFTGIDPRSLKKLKQLQSDFPRALLHFNHIIKLHEHKVIDLESLLLLHSRGAGVLCGNNQTAIDGILNFAKDGGALAPDNAGLILWQSKLDMKFTDKPRRCLFDAMDPHELGILGEHDGAIPLIKIVFALAARKPALHVARTEQDGIIVYEIWCAGISPNILAPIEERNVPVWDALLQASYGWKDLYSKASPGARDLRRSVNVGAASESGHWVSWACRQT